MATNKKGETTVKQRNEVIRGRAAYTFLEEKLFILIYSKLSSFEEELPPIVLQTSEVCKALSTRGEDMRRALKKLTTTPIEIGSIDDLENPYEVVMPITRFRHDVSRIVGAAKIIENSVTIFLNSEMKKYFLGLKSEFSHVVAEHCYRLSSRYSIRVFKVVSQWMAKIEALGEFEIRFDYFEMRDFFKFKSSQYGDPSKFKRDVFLPALADINRAQIGLDVELSRVGKSGKFVTEYFVLAKKTNPMAPKRVAPMTKKEISDEEIISKNQTRFDEILSFERAQPDLPNIGFFSPEIRDIRLRATALKGLKNELKI